jgi:hypothetical protein
LTGARLGWYKKAFVKRLTNACPACRRCEE